MTINAGSKDTGNAGSDDKEDDEGEGTVAYATYKKALDQRKVDRDRARDLQAKLDAANADKEAAEAKRLADDAQWKALYEKEKAKTDGLSSQLQQMTTSQIEAKKREAVKTALGGVRKDDYLKFIDLGSVQINDDGSIDAESVKATANKFRESYPELVTVKGSGKAPNEAASDFKGPAPKKLSELSTDEKRSRLAALSAKK